MIYPRIVLKLSGEALTSQTSAPIDPHQLHHYAQEIATAHHTGTQIVVIIGGGNLWRGQQAPTLGIKPTQAHAMGMLATLMNSLALHQALQAHHVPTALLSRLPIPTLCNTYQPSRALHILAQNTVLIIGGGLGNAFFSTDTAAVTTALDLQATVCLKGTKVDGVYPQDPVKQSMTKPYETIPLTHALDKKLGIMDLTALALAHDHHLPLIVYNAHKKNTLTHILQGQKAGTLLTPEPKTTQ